MSYLFVSYGARTSSAVTLLLSLCLCVLTLPTSAQTRSVLNTQTSGVPLHEQQKLKSDQRNLRENLEAMYQKLSADIKNEGSFSLTLADSYFSYAELLSEAGEYAEANVAYEMSLHIQKTNHGISAAEQLPALEAIFNNQFTTAEIGCAENSIADVINIEDENPQITDRPSTLMLLKIGHICLAKLQATSPTNELSAKYLKLANKYFLTIIERNKNKKLSKALFPYGELAMTVYLGNKITRKPEKIYIKDAITSSIGLLNELRGISRVQTNSYSAPIEDLVYNDELNRSTAMALATLKHYFSKAYHENNAVEALNAALVLGDLSFLNKSFVQAKKYYALAGELAYSLPENHPDRLALSQPSQLPEFKYALDSVVNQNQLEDPNTLVVPMKFDVDDKGRIKNIKTMVEVERNVVSKAKREIRKYPFRPAINEGVLTQVDEFVYAVAVNLD